jgi:hypothetical protein
MNWRRLWRVLNARLKAGFSSFGHGKLPLSIWVKNKNQVQSKRLEYLYKVSWSSKNVLCFKQRMLFMNYDFIRKLCVLAGDNICTQSYPLTPRTCSVTNSFCSFFFFWNNIYRIFLFLRGPLMWFKHSEYSASVCHASLIDCTVYHNPGSFQ